MGVEKKRSRAELKDTESTAVRIKMSRFRLLQEIVGEMVAKNPLLRGKYTETDLIRAVVDDYLVKQGKLKAKEI
jgi:hypothetical protein